MPGAAAGAVYTAAIAAGATAVVATVAYVAVYLAVSIAIAYAFAAITKALAGSPGDLASEASGRQSVVRSAAEPRRLVYGVVKVAGPLVFAATTGVDNALLHLVIPVAGSEINAISQVWFNDVQLPVTNGPVTTGKFANRAAVYSHLGQPGQTVDTFLQTAVGTGIWDSTHVLSDTAYLYVQLTWDQTVYSGGIPHISAVVQGRKLYDPRTALTVYSTNSALVVRDYLTHPHGLKCAATDLDDATFITAANICDEAVGIVGGGTQVRYDANGTIPLDMPRKTAIEQILTSCAGYLVFAQGVYKLYAGAYRTPTETLTESNLAGPIRVSPKVSRSELFNAVRGQFVNPDAAWQAVDYPAVRNAAYKAEDNNEEIFADLALPFTTNPARAQRIAKIMLEKSRQSTTVAFPGNLTCFKVQPLDTVMLTIAKLGWVSKVFLCVGWSFTESGQVILTLQEEAASVYTWANGAETLIDQAPNTNLPNPLDVQPPTSFTITSSGEFLVAGNGQVTTRLRLSWVPPADTYVKTSGRIDVQFKETSASAWLTAPSEVGAALGTWLSPVRPGASYDVRVRAVNSLEVYSTWVTATGHIAAAPSFSDNSDNLIPNPNSEVGAPAVGVIPDGTGLVNDAVNAFAGQWVRRFTATTSVQTALLSSKLAAAPGDQYYFEAYLKSSVALVAAANLVLQYFDAAGNLSTTSTTAHLASTTYVRVGVTGTVPAGSTAIRAAVSYGGASDNAKNLFVDNMYMRRMVNGSVIQDDSIGDSQLTNGYNNDNMIPNANSELGTLAVGRDPEGNGLVNDAGNSLAGSWCRRTPMSTVGSNTVILTNYIPVSPGETFAFEGYLKASAAQTTDTSWLAFEFTDANKANPVDVAGVQVALTTSYAKYTNTKTVPPGKLFMRAYFNCYNISGTNTAKIAYGDSFVLKRILSGVLDGNAFSDNLVANGSFEGSSEDWAPIYTTRNWGRATPGDAPEGNWVMRIGSPLPAPGEGITMRSFPVTPTDTYTVRFKLRHSNGSGLVYAWTYESTTQPPTGFLGDAGFPNVANTPGSIGPAFLSAAPASNYTTWKLHEAVYTPSAGARWVSLSFLNHGSSTGTLDIDEVEVRRQISTEHIEDNAVIVPVTSSTEAAIDVKATWNTVLSIYRDPIVQIATITTSGAPVEIKALGTCNLVASSAVSQIIARSYRTKDSVGITSITVTSNTVKTFTVVTSAPHNLVGGDGFIINGSGSTEFNTTSTSMYRFNVTTVVSATSFTFNTGGPFAGATPANGTVYSGGSLSKYFVAFAGSLAAPVYMLRVPASTSYTVTAHTSALDFPPAATWSYYMIMTSLDAGFAPTATPPTTSTVAQSTLTLLEIKK